MKKSEPTSTVVPKPIPVLQAEMTYSGIVHLTGGEMTLDSLVITVIEGEILIRNGAETNAPKYLRKGDTWNIRPKIVVK